MKKVLLASIFTLIIALSSAQNPNGWIQQGAETYHAYNLDHENGYVRFYLSEEFEINGKMLQRLSGEKKYRYQTGPDTWVEHPQIIPVTSMLYHTSNDTVYYANEQGELRFAWHMNPQVGDVWDFGLHGLFSADTLIRAYGVVIQVTPVNINGIETLDIRWRSCIDSLGTLPPDFQELQQPYLQGFHEGIINTLLGPRNNFFFQFFYEIAPMPGPIVCFFQSSALACYQSNDVDLIHFLSSQSCTNNVASIETLEITKFKVYPNPSSTTLMLDHPELVQSYAIFTPTGSIILKGSSFPINVLNWPSGAYFIRIDSIQGSSTIERFVVE
jgi:hypothetical protein